MEMASLVKHLKAAPAFGMVINVEKTTLMTNTSQGTSADIQVSGTTLEKVETFEYLGPIISDESSKPEIVARIAQTTAVLARLRTI